MKYLFIFFLLIFVISCNEKIQEKPNILLISLDDLRADSLGCYGYSRNTSPFIDYISTQGILFKNCFVNTHGTFSSHTTILTGLYQSSYFCGKGGIDFKVNKNVPMVQDFLRKNGYFCIGVTDGGLLSKAYGFDKGFDIYDDKGEGIINGTNKVINYLKENPKKEPFFIFYHTYEIHSPYTPPPPYDKIFGEYKSNINPTNEVLLNYVHSAWRDLSKEDLNFLKARYDGSIKYVDDNLLIFFQKLQEIGFFKNYLLILTADHGEEFGEHGGLLHRDFLYEELIHIPLIISGTKVEKNKKIDHLCNHIDIASTILKFAGIEKPDYLQGKDLLSLKKRNFIFSQYEDRRYSLRTKRWKFILNSNGKIELYDLLIDKGEKNNIFLEKEKLCLKFKEEIKRILKEIPNFCQENLEKANLTKEDYEKLKSLGYIK
jgi:arylsulfatase A-like enzyme